MVSVMKILVVELIYTKYLLNYYHLVTFSNELHVWINKLAKYNFLLIFVLKHNIDYILLTTLIRPKVQYQTDGIGIKNEWHHIWCSHKFCKLSVLRIYQLHIFSNLNDNVAFAQF